MSKFGEIAPLSEEMLATVVGGSFTDAQKDYFREVAEWLKRMDLSHENALEWFSQETAGCRFSDEEWQEIVDIVNFVYGE